MAEKTQVVAKEEPKPEKKAAPEKRDVGPANSDVAAAAAASPAGDDDGYLAALKKDLLPTNTDISASGVSYKAGPTETTVKPTLKKDEVGAGVKTKVKVPGATGPDGKPKTQGEVRGAVQGSVKSTKDGRVVDGYVEKGWTLEQVERERREGDDKKKKKKKKGIGVDVGFGITDERAYGQVKDRDGEVVADRFVDGKGVRGKVGVDAKVVGGAVEASHDKRVSGLAMRGPDGAKVDRETLEKRTRTVTDRDASGPDAGKKVDRFMATVAGMKKGDRYTLDTKTAGSVDVNAGLVGVGAGKEDRTSRTVEALGDGKVRVTIATYDATSGKLSVGKGLSGEVGKEVGERNVQAIEFDLKTPEGRRDLMINQYTGLLPGQAAKLGITDEKSAKEFLAAGGMKAVKDGSWTRGSVDPKTTVADLNRKALEKPEDIPGLTLSTKEAAEKVEASAKVLGFSLFTGSNEHTAQEKKERNPDGTYKTTTIDKNKSRSSFLWFDEDGAESKLSLDSEGKLKGEYNSDSVDRDKLVVNGKDPSEALLAASDDPVERMKVEADINKITEVLRRQAAEAKANGATPTTKLDPRVMDELQYRFSLDLPKGGQAVLAKAAKDAGIDPSKLKKRVAAELRDSKGDISKLSPEALKVFAATSTAMNGGAGLKVMQQLAMLPKEKAGPAIRAALLGLGASGVKDFAAWAKKNPELAKHVDVSSEVLAGSTDANAIVNAKEGKPDEKAGRKLLDKLAAIKDPAERKAFLDGLNKTAGGFDAKGGGLDKMLDKMTPSQAAELLRSAGKHPAVAAYLKKNPGAAIPPDVPYDKRAEWAEKNLKGKLGDDVDLQTLVAASDAAFTKGISKETMERFGKLHGDKDAAAMFAGQDVHQVQDMLKWLDADKGKNFNRLASLAKQMGKSPAEVARLVFSEKDPVKREYLMQTMGGLDGDRTAGPSANDDRYGWMRNESIRRVVEGSTGGKRFRMKNEDDGAYLTRLRRGGHRLRATDADYYRERRKARR